MNYEKNLKYFKSPPIKQYIVGIIISLLFFALGLEIVGILILMTLGIYFYLNNINVPSDDEIDEICKNEFERAKLKSLSKLGLDGEEVKQIEPIYAKGSYFKNISSQFLLKIGKDKKFRSSNYEMTILYFTEEQVHAYSYCFSIISSEKRESTQEYFYKDIVSISTNTDTISIKEQKSDKKPKVIDFEEFLLTTSGGTNISCSILDSQNFGKSIQGMKQLIREKKQSLEMSVNS